MHKLLTLKEKLWMRNFKIFNLRYIFILNWKYFRQTGKYIEIRFSTATFVKYGIVIR